MSTQLTNTILQEYVAQQSIMRLEAITAEDSWGACHEADEALLRFLDAAGYTEVAEAYRRCQRRYGKTEGYWHG